MRRDNLTICPSDFVIGQITKQTEQTMSIENATYKQHVDELKTKNSYLSELNDQLRQKIIEMEERYHSMADYLEDDMQKFLHHEEELSRKEEHNKQLISTLEHKKTMINQKNTQIKESQSTINELQSTINELHSTIDEWEQKYKLLSKNYETLSQQCEELSQTNGQLHDKLTQYEREKEKQTYIISKLEDKMRERTSSPSQSKSKNKQRKQKGSYHSMIPVIFGFCLYALLLTPLM